MEGVSGQPPIPPEAEARWGHRVILQGPCAFLGQVQTLGLGKQWFTLVALRGAPAGRTVSEAVGVGLCPFPRDPLPVVRSGALPASRL